MGLNVMKHARQRAITRCHMEGYGLTGREFDRLLRKHNNNEMKLDLRCMLIARKWDDDFFNVVKEHFKSIIV